MGYASYLEDIRDRLDRSNRDLDEVTSALGVPNPTRANRDDALRVLANAKVLLRRIHQTLDLATDPQLNLAHEVEQQREVIRGLERDVELAQHERDRVEQEVVRAKQGMAKAIAEVQRIELKNRELEAQFESLPFSVQQHLYPPKSQG